MKLYDGGRAPNPRRVRIYLAEKGIAIPFEQIDLGSMQHKSAAYAAINPLMRVPALVLDDGTVITESIAICRYFEALHPAPPMFGEGGLEQAMVEMWTRRVEQHLLVVSDGWSGANPEAVSYGLELKTPVAQQVEWLTRREAPYLQTAPSNALALAYATAQRTQELPIEFIFGIGETVSNHDRDVVRERLGARLAGIYSCQEVGFIATECPAAPHYHVVAENALVDIVGDDGRPVAPGELGRVVVTGLYNYAMPFIRYAVGDVASWAAVPCRCGRSLPVIAQVEGRTRSAFVFRDGKRMWPRGWDGRDMRAFVPFREFQMVQLDHERIEFRYVPDGSGRARLGGARRLRACEIASLCRNHPGAARRHAARTEREIRAVPVSGTRRLGGDIAASIIADVVRLILAISTYGARRARKWRNCAAAANLPLNCAFSVWE
jgi:glutathione S-transferase